MPAVGAEEGEQERRVDPADGNAYTEREFVEAYGEGSAEWANAAVDPAAAAGKKSVSRVDAAKAEFAAFEAERVEKENAAATAKAAATETAAAEAAEKTAEEEEAELVAAEGIIENNETGLVVDPVSFAFEPAAAAEMQPMESKEEEDAEEEEEKEDVAPLPLSKEADAAVGGLGAVPWAAGKADGGGGGGGGDGGAAEEEASSPTKSPTKPKKGPGLKRSLSIKDSKTGVVAMALGRLDAGLETRYDVDGLPYKRSDFVEHYQGSAEWDAAEPERRIDADGAAYTRMEFEDLYHGWVQRSPAVV
eukprot:SAG22_NODE_1415_length_4470_cov_28.138412_5_plen_305_part_00